MCAHEKRTSMSFQFAAELCAHGGPQYGAPFLTANMARTALKTFMYAAVVHLAVTSSRTRRVPALRVGHRWHSQITRLLIY